MMLPFDPDVQCRICQTRGPRFRAGKRIKECGVTEISVHNAHLDIEQFGQPFLITLVAKNGEYEVRIDWHDSTSRIVQPDDGIQRQYTGMAWGYGGTGPHGLLKLFQMVGLPYTIVEIAQWDQEAGRLINVAGNAHNVKV